MRSTLALAATALAGLAASQDTPQNNYPYTIDPNSVSQGDRDAWCLNQQAQCPLICTQQPGVNSLTTLANDCDSDALEYNCICENGVVPNVTQYSQTLPFYICQQWGTNCVANCGGDNTCANSCRADHPCGAQSPYRGNTSIPSTSSLSPTASGGSQMGSAASVSGGAKPTGQTFGGSGGTGAAAGLFVPSAGVSFAALLGSVFLGFAVLL